MGSLESRIARLEAIANTDAPGLWLVEQDGTLWNPATEERLTVEQFEARRSNRPALVREYVGVDVEAV